MIKNVAVVGLGYVGLPLSLQIVASGFQVTGIDSDEKRVRSLSQGHSFTRDISAQALLSSLETGLTVSSSFDAIKDAQVVVICVPTPLDDSGERPDLTYVLRAVREISTRIEQGTTVILESTVAPGTTDGVVLEEFLVAGLSVDKDFYLGYSPERINPGSQGQGVGQVPKIVAGSTTESRRRITAFYEQVVDCVVELSGTREAEFAKLLENTYRLVNISLINELALAASHMGVDFREVVRGAATKPFGFHAFFPSAGAGGHCIPIDPVYLATEVYAQTGEYLSVANAAIDVNRRTPGRFVDQLIASQGAVEGKDVLVVGMSYKSGVSDVRNSPALTIVERLMDLGSFVWIYDDAVAEVTVRDQRFESVDLLSSDQMYDFALVLQSQGDSTIELIRNHSRKIYTAAGFWGEM